VRGKGAVPSFGAAPAITIDATMAPATRPSRGVSLQGLGAELVGAAPVEPPRGRHQKRNRILGLSTAVLGGFW
jgi:hypothetical protein